MILKPATTEQEANERRRILEIQFDHEATLSGQALIQFNKVRIPYKVNMGKRVLTLDRKKYN